MPEELNSCSCLLHVTGFRKPQPQSQPAWGIRLRKHCPPVFPQAPACSQLGTAGISGTVGEYSWDRGSARAGHHVFCVWPCSGYSSFPPKAPMQSWDTTFYCAHTHRVHCIFLIISANHPPGCSDRWSRLTSAQRNDKPVSSPSQLDTRPPPRFIPTTTRFCSQQTITALGQNLPVLMVIRSRLGTAGTLRAGVLWHPAWT